MKKKKYTFDETFFDKIDSEQKAYILGLLFADGYNHESRGVISLSLLEIDKEIMERINEYLHSNRPLQFLDMKKYHRGKSHQNQFRLNLSSHYTSTILSKIGCSQNKSTILKFPPIVSSLLHHFIRGYFDGDGCVSYSKNKDGRPCGTISFVSANKFCEALREILKSIEISSSLLRDKKYHENMRILKFGGRKQLIKFFNYLYKDATLYFSRKYVTFQRFISESNDYLTQNKSLGIYQNTKRSKLPFRVVKTKNKKTIHVGSFSSEQKAIEASTNWDTLYGKEVVALY